MAFQFACRGRSSSLQNAKPSSLNFRRSFRKSYSPISVCWPSADPISGALYVDSLYGSKLSNLKELRFTADGEWRFAFAFDPKSTGIVLIGGDKQGQNQKKFYKTLISTA